MKHQSVDESTIGIGIGIGIVSSMQDQMASSTSSAMDTSTNATATSTASNVNPNAAQRSHSTRNIWEEMYPLIQPANQYHKNLRKGHGSGAMIQYNYQSTEFAGGHHHKSGGCNGEAKHHKGPGGSNSYFYENMFSSEVTCAYKDAILAFLVALFSVVTLAITGLIFCKQWGLPTTSAPVVLCKLLWQSSPIVASFALRNIANQRLQACHTPSNWTIPPFSHMFKCFPTRTMLRLSLLSYAIPLLCEMAAFSFTAATRMVNPFNRSFVQKVEKVFTFNDVEALESGLVFYVFYIVFVGIFWDPLPPRRYDFGLAMGIRPTGCSWFLQALIQEIGWSGSLFPALDVVFSHSTILASAITGMIWALWHWPLIIVEAMGAVPDGSGYVVVETKQYHVAYILAAFTLLLVGSRIIMCWIQGNANFVIWSSVVYHATHKLYIISVFGQLTAPLYEKAHMFSFFNSEASVCLLITVWFSTCILSQMFRCSYSTIPSFFKRTSSNFKFVR